MIVLGGVDDAGSHDDRRGGDGATAVAASARMH